jgi:hypothetical protein
MRLRHRITTLAVTTVMVGVSLFASGTPAQADNTVVEGGVTNAAGSASGYVRVYYDSNNPGNVYARVTAYDIKADGYCARAYGFFVNDDGDIPSESVIAEVCGNGTSATVTVPSVPAGLVASVHLVVWNGSSGPKVYKTISF